MGIEPTWACSHRPTDGFEDRAAHQNGCASTPSRVPKLTRPSRRLSSGTPPPAQPATVSSRARLFGVVASPFRVSAFRLFGLVCAEARTLNTPPRSAHHDGTLNIEAHKRQSCRPRPAASNTTLLARYTLPRPLDSTILAGYYRFSNGRSNN